jgi:hypothetical protein
MRQAVKELLAGKGSCMFVHERPEKKTPGVVCCSQKKKQSLRCDLCSVITSVHIGS